MDRKLTYSELEKRIGELEQQIEKYIKKDEKVFEHLIKNSFDMLVLLDSNGIQQYVSESCERILGYKPEELIHIPVIEQYLHPEDKEPVKDAFTSLIKNLTHGGVQYRHRHKNGSWVYLEAFGTNQLDNPLINSLVLNVRDITDRKKVEQDLIESKARLAEANATKDRFFSIIAHDLRSPFHTIVGFSNLLKEKIKSADYSGLEDYATIIKDSSNRAMNLLTNLLEWSRAQTGRIEFNPEYFELTPVINEVIELLNNTAQQKSINISHKSISDVSVKADKSMVKTILRNLISNAIKFTNPNGEIIISSQHQDNEIIVSVTDNGVGIKKEDIDKLFRIESSHSTDGTDKEKGTGLGLLLCKEFIKLNGGKIWVISNEGKGSIFNFSLPHG